MKKGAILLASLDALTDGSGVAALAKAGVTSVAMERMPRSSRAQSMDILSSQANLAGYKAVLDAASIANINIELASPECTVPFLSLIHI